MSGVSVQTIKSPEFININSVSPLISKCEIKVLYTGQNRNRSFITKEVAQEMAQTLPGTPIVGYYSENAEDFRDHGEQMIWDGDGIRFNCLTKPYGFVPTDTKIWFKEFEDTDEFGNKVLREYLMCEGYLWTEQYKEAKKVIESGRPHSMELDEKTLKGHWSTDNNSGIEFFIINDAIFSKLCILGEDVEPCFEGSAVTAPDVSSSFTLDSNEFKNTLFTMMKELKEYTASLNNGKGGNLMGDNMNSEVQGAENSSAQVSENSLNEVDNNVETGFTQTDNTLKTKFDGEGGEGGEGTGEGGDATGGEGAGEGGTGEGGEPASGEGGDDPSGGTDLAAGGEEPGADPAGTEPGADPSLGDDDQNDDDDDDEGDDDEGDKPDPATEDEEGFSKRLKELEESYSLLEQNYNELQKECTNLKEENKNLLTFKNNIEDQQKTELINSFDMLSDEDKKEISDNKSMYTLQQIKEKLSAICFDKRIPFNSDSEQSVNVTTYNLNSVNQNNSNLPAWLKAVEATKQKNN